MLDPSAPELSDLVVMMAHDLKNPLAALMTNLHFLQGALAEPDQDALDALGDSVTLCEVLERFLRNLDLLGRREALVARGQVVGIGALAHEAVNRIHSYAKAAGIGLRFSDAHAAELAVFVDRDLFSRAVENMLANAVEHAPAGSTVEVRVVSTGNEAAIVVTDEREALPALRSSETALVPFETGEGRRLHGLYGRGLALLCADLAARATGVRLEIDGTSRSCRLRLVAPVRE
jgi:signal transduction histidine kinase